MYESKQSITSLSVYVRLPYELKSDLRKQNLSQNQNKYYQTFTLAEKQGHHCQEEKGVIDTRKVHATLTD